MVIDHVAIRGGPSPAINAREAEPAVWSLVGSTPLVALPVPAAVPRAKLFLKAEWFNPGGSAKDRAAREILRAGLAAGELPGRRLLDASSGNTAVAYAMLAAAAGIRVTLCVPANASAARRRLLDAFGAETIATDPLEGSDGAIRKARELAAARPEHYWYADQYNHPANPRAHVLTTGPEIWRATGGQITHLIAGIGTGGTLTGLGRFFRGKRRDIQLIAVQPDRPLHGLEGLKHLETALVPGVYDGSLANRTVFVATEAAERRVAELARSQGVFTGWSAGAALVAAETILAETVWRNEDAPVVVVIAPDGGTNYIHDVRHMAPLV